MKTTKEIGLRFVLGYGLRLSVYTDADYVVASNDRRSVSGIPVILGDTAIGWKSSTQKCVTTARCEAEHVALCDASKEALFTRTVLVFLQPDLTRMRVDIFGDNEGAKAIADNPSSASRSKHIDVKLHFVGISFERGSSVCCTWEPKSSMQMSSRNPSGGRSLCCTAGP